MGVKEVAPVDPSGPPVKGFSISLGAPRWWRLFLPDAQFDLSSHLHELGLPFVIYFPGTPNHIFLTGPDHAASRSRLAR